MEETQNQQTNQNVSFLLGELKGLIVATNSKIDIVIASAQREIADARKESDGIKVDLEAKDRCWHSKFDQIQTGKESAHEAIESMIGEVPQGKTVMSSLRETNDKVNRVYIVASVVGAIYLLVSPFLNPLIKSLFHTNP